MILNYTNKAVLPYLKSEVLCGWSPPIGFLKMLNLTKPFRKTQGIWGWGDQQVIPTIFDDAGWSNTKDLNEEKLPTCVSKGYLISQKNGVTRIFTDYIKNKDKPTFETIGNTTLIPTAVIESIKKIN